MQANSNLISNVLGTSAFWMLNKRLVEELNGNYTAAVLIAELVSRRDYFHAQGLLDSENGFYGIGSEIEKVLCISKDVRLRTTKFLKSLGLIATVEKTTRTPTVGLQTLTYYYIDDEKIAAIVSQPMKGGVGKHDPRGVDGPSVSNEMNSLEAKGRGASGNTTGGVVKHYPGGSKTHTEVRKSTKKGEERGEEQQLSEASQIQSFDYLVRSEVEEMMSAINDAPVPSSDHALARTISVPVPPQVTEVPLPKKASATVSVRTILNGYPVSKDYHDRPDEIRQAVYELKVAGHLENDVKASFDTIVATWAPPKTAKMKPETRDWVVEQIKCNVRAAIAEFFPSAVVPPKAAKPAKAPAPKVDSRKQPSSYENDYEREYYAQFAPIKDAAAAKEHRKKIEQEMMSAK